jgi:hypothetical protein
LEFASANVPWILRKHLTTAPKRNVRLRICYTGSSQQ